MTTKRKEIINIELEESEFEFVLEAIEDRLYKILEYAEEGKFKYGSQDKRFNHHIKVAYSTFLKACDLQWFPTEEEKEVYINQIKDEVKKYIRIFNPRPKRG